MSDSGEYASHGKHFHRRSSDTSSEKEGEDTQGSSEKGKNKNGDDAPKKMSPKKKLWLIIIAIIAGVILIIGAVSYWLYARQYETTDDAFIDGHVSQISARVGGQIQSLLIVDNEHVQTGQLLTEIDPRDYQVRLARAEAEHAQAVAQVALQKANIGQAEANVEVAKAELFQAERDLKRFKSVNPKAITKQQLDNAITNARSANAKLMGLHKTVEEAKSQKAAAEASVKQTQVAIDNAQLQLSYTKIVAPITGRIARRTVEVGNVVAPGVPLLAVVSDDLWVTANYKETQLTHMRIGQPVRIEVDAFPDAIFSGHIDSFQKGTGSEFSILPAENATGNYVKVVQRVPVKVVFDNLQERDKYPLSPGLSVDPRVTVR